MGIGQTAIESPSIHNVGHCALCSAEALSGWLLVSVIGQEPLNYLYTGTRPENIDAQGYAASETERHLGTPWELSIQQILRTRKENSCQCYQRYLCYKNLTESVLGLIFLKFFGHK